jgi:hypothetical protein
MGPKPVSTVLTAEQQAGAVAFRQQTQLPLDDCLYALQEMRLSIWAYSPARALRLAPPVSAPRHQAPAGPKACREEKEI